MTSLTLATFVNPASSANFEVHEIDGRSVDVYKVALKNLTDAMDAKNLAGSISSSSSMTHNDKAPTDGGDFDIASTAVNLDNPVEVPNQKTTKELVTYYSLC
jgi:hypothetical protein